MCDGRFPCPVEGPYRISTTSGDSNFADSGILKDVGTLLDRMDDECHDCQGTPQFIWVESAGLTADTFEEVLDRGVTATLLVHNPPPMCVCAGCCVERIARDLRMRDLSYLEVSPPTGAEAGFVLPMGY